MIYGNDELYKQFSSIATTLKTMIKTVNDGYWRIMMSGAVDISQSYSDFCGLYQKEAATIGSVAHELMNTVQAMTYTDGADFYDGVTFKVIEAEGATLPEANGNQSSNSYPRAIVTEDTVNLLGSLVSDMLYVSNVRLSTPARTNNQLLNTIRFYGSVIPKAIFPRIGYAWAPVEGMNNAQKSLFLPAYGMHASGGAEEMVFAKGGAMITPRGNNAENYVGRPFTKLISEVLLTIRIVSRDGVLYLYVTLNIIPTDTTNNMYFRTRTSSNKNLYQSYLGMSSFLSTLNESTIAAGVNDNPTTGRAACDVIRFNMPEFPSSDGSKALYYTGTFTTPATPYGDFRYVQSVYGANWTATRPSSGLLSSEENINTLEKIMLMANWKVVGVDVTGSDIGGKHYPTLLLATQISGDHCQIYKYLSDREASQVSLWSVYSGSPIAVRFLSNFRYQKVWHAYGPNT